MSSSSASPTIGLSSAIPQSPADGTTAGPSSMTGGAVGSPYSYGPARIRTGPSKLPTGTGVGSCHSSERAIHGLAGAGTRETTSDHTKFARNTSIDAPRRNAALDTQT